MTRGASVASLFKTIIMPQLSETSPRMLKIIKALGYSKEKQYDLPVCYSVCSWC